MCCDDVPPVSDLSASRHLYHPLVSLAGVEGFDSMCLVDLLCTTGYAPSMLSYVRGTPGFMAPEVCVGVHVTLDLFGAGSPGWGGGIDVMDSGGTDLAGESPYCTAAHVKKRV